MVSCCQFFQVLVVRLRIILKSVEVYKQVVQERVSKEISEGRVAGPFSSPPLENFRVSPLGIVPKKIPHCFQVIHHFSFPNGQPLNDKMYASSCSVS